MIDERIQQLIIGLIFKSSIYGFILSMCRLQPDENVPHVMWVSFDRECNPILGYNPIRTQELEAKEIMMIFKHECFHLANNHITRGNKLFDMYSTYFQNQPKKLHDIINMALDFAVNSLIPEFQNTKKYLYPTNHDLPLNLTAEHYFNILLEINNTGSSPECKSQKGADGLKEMMNRSETCDHEMWISQELAEKLQESNYFNEKMENKIEEIIKSSIEKSRSCHANCDQISAAYQKAFEKSIPYYELIKRFVKSQRKGMRENTLSKMNRKRAWVFHDNSDRFICPFPGSMQLPTFKIGNILDTSGSMDEQSILVGLSGISSLIESDRYVDCTVIEVDQEIVKEYKVKRIADIQFNVNGHRGTTLISAFERMKELKVDVVLCFTDGYCENFNQISRTLLPKNIIWVITKGGTDSMVNNTGRVVFANRDSAEA